MRWAAEHPSEAGVSRKVSSEFNEADPGGKLPAKKDSSSITREADCMMDAMRHDAELDTTLKGLPGRKPSSSVSGNRYQARTDARGAHIGKATLFEHNGVEADVQRMTRR